MLLVAIVVLAGLTQRSSAATTINSANKYGYGANIGWIDWRGDINNGGVIGEYVCSGYLWIANCGWINLGNGTPANGIRYQNNSATDFGLNHDGLGNLRGYAYAANIGWISFETTGNPRVDLKTGRLVGAVWSANCRWISLSNAFAFVQTDVIRAGADVDGDGIADGWELTYTNHLASFTADSDTDGDGVSDLKEYLADTSPLDPNDFLRVKFYSVQFGGGGETNLLTWTTKPSRCYQINYRTNLTAGTPWLDGTAVFSPDAGTQTTRILLLSLLLPERYFQIKAVKPLAP